MKSRNDINQSVQRRTLRSAGADLIFIENTFSPKDRTQFNLLLEKIKSGDTLIIWKVSRLGCSFKDLAGKIIALLEKGVGMVCQTYDLNVLMENTSILCGLLTALINYDHSVRKENTMNGLETATAEGHKGGRKSMMSLDIKERALLAKMIYEQNYFVPLPEIWAKLKISKSNYYRYSGKTE